MLVYVYSKCSTCQNAINFLLKYNIKFEKREITLTPPSVAELHTMLKRIDGNLKKLFNTSGQLYRQLEMGKKLETMPLDEALQLLSKNGMLVKRPFVLGAEVGVTGFNEKEWIKKFT